MLEAIKGLRNYLSLTDAAKRERAADRRGLPEQDPGPVRIADLGIGWLHRAQDCSSTRDGGVARHYSLLSGWGSSYPETTGYIVPTLIGYGRSTGDGESLRRAKLMLDWFRDIQFPEGGFQGGRIDSVPVVPVTFNTGQILLGLAAGAVEFGDYLENMRRAADWLVATQDRDGCWRRHPTPFAKPGEKAYETHVAWGLIEAHRILPERGYAEAALANVRWALKKQRQNGWVEDCCLDDPARPLTHTLGYFLRGLLECYKLVRDPGLLDAARRTADGLLSALGAHGRLPGRLSPDWGAAVHGVCLTGSVQVAHCWLMLYQITGERRYLDAGKQANAFVRRTIRVTGQPNTLGAVKGSFPVQSEYGSYEYPNWATKFCVDSNLLELLATNPNA